MSVNVVFFDVGGVLEDRGAVDAAGVVTISAAALDRGEASAIEPVVSRYRTELVGSLGDKPWENRYFYWRELLLRTGVRAPSQVDVDAVYGRYLDIYATLVRPYNDVLSTLEELRAAGLQLGLLTNATRAKTERFLDVCELRELFPLRAVSEDFGATKPSAQFFRFALRMAAAAPEACLHVGDRPDNDYGPAVALGMHAVLIRRDGAGAAAGAGGARTVETLAELPGLIESLA